MILTDEEMDQVRSVIEAQAGLDEELMQRCGHLVHQGAFDEAVRSAFVLLEERLREAVTVGPQRFLSGIRLVDAAFSPEKGSLAKRLGNKKPEWEAVRNLYAGAFTLFRNPTAHGVVDYDEAEGKAILGLVSLLLRMLGRAQEAGPDELLPDHVNRGLASVEGTIGAGATSRLRRFLVKCVTEAGVRPIKAKNWIPFRRQVLYKLESWDQPRPHSAAVFYLVVAPGRHDLTFPVNQYYANAIDFNTDRLLNELVDLGFYPRGSNQEPTIDLVHHNDRAFFDRLFGIVTWVTEEFQESLRP